MIDQPIHLINLIHKLNGHLGLMRVIIGTLEIEMKSQLEENDSLYQLFEHLKNENHQAQTLVRDELQGLVEIMDSTNERLPPLRDTKKVSVKTSIRNALSSMSLPTSIVLDLEIEDNLPEVYANKLLVDVFKNLFANAIDAMPDGGKLHISAHQSNIMKSIEITVTDSGRGIPSHIVADTFRIRLSTNKNSLGIGLWWTKNYLLSIGGEIKLLWSQPDKGSSFQIVLPLAQE